MATAKGEAEAQPSAYSERKGPALPERLDAPERIYRRFVHRLGELTHAQQLALLKALDDLSVGPVAVSKPDLRNLRPVPAEESPNAPEKVYRRLVARIDRMRPLQRLSLLHFLDLMLPPPEKGSPSAPGHSAEGEPEDPADLPPRWKKRGGHPAMEHAGKISMDEGAEMQRLFDEERDAFFSHHYEEPPQFPE